MITHYGLFWSAFQVFWGKTGPGNGGQMLGRTKTRGKGRRRPPETERPPVVDYGVFVGVYCLHSGNSLVYVGKAGLDSDKNLLRRLKDHRTDRLAGQWDTFSWFGSERCDGNSGVKEALLQMEAALIAVINPAFNRHDGSFGSAEEVFQVAHEQAEGDIETQLTRIRQAMNRASSNGTA